MAVPGGLSRASLGVAERLPVADHEENRHMGTPERPTAAAGGGQRRLPMSQLFRRNRPEEGDQAPPPTLVASTGIVCTLAGCSNDTARPCAYRDGRGRACGAVYCPEHGVSTDGKFYCRRHAGVLRAVGAQETPQGGLPDVDNRAPSLVSWIARDLDANVRRLLSGAALPGESVIADETVHVARDFTRKARWEQSWRLVDHTGQILKVTIQVFEENDTLVRVHVGSGVIADAVPPWIVHRTEDSDVATDTAHRQRFYLWLDESIFMAVDRFRTERQRLN